MLRRVLLFVLVCAACKKPDAPARLASSPPSAASSPAITSAAPAPAPAPTPAVNDATLTSAFWSTDALIVASNESLWKLRLGPSGATLGARIETDGSELVFANGADVFLLLRKAGAERWSTTRLEKLGAIDHPLPLRGGAIAPSGLVALGGCAEIAGHADLATSCGELYDRDGKHTASFTTKHGFDAMTFSADGRYLAAKAFGSGVTVIDTTSGKSVVERPRWAFVQEVHAWNHPDVLEVQGAELVISHGDTVEHVDLASGKTLGKLVVPGRTLATYAPRTRRVAIFEGERGRLRIWDVARHVVTRTFELAKYVGNGANCLHCAVDFDDADEDRLWLTSAYTNDRLELDAKTGAVTEDRSRPRENEGLPDATGRYRARLHDGIVDVWDTERKALVATVGQAPARPIKKTKQK